MWDPFPLRVVSLILCSAGQPFENELVVRREFGSRSRWRVLRSATRLLCMG